MPWFRSKPRVMEAWQYSGQEDCRGACTCPRVDRPHVHSGHNDQTIAIVFGDWITPEPHFPGRFYPIKDEVMRERYEECAPLGQPPADGPDGPGNFPGPDVDLQATQGFPAHD